MECKGGGQSVQMCGNMEEGRWAVRTQYIDILAVTKKSSPNGAQVCLCQ